MKYPYMPLFQGDLLADTLHLSAQEFGAYMLLILHAWKHDAEICVKDAQRIARVTNPHWPKVRDKLARFFEPQDGLHGVTVTVTHSRVALQLSLAGEISSKRKDAAMQMHAKQRANALQKHMHPLSNPDRESSNGKEGETSTVQMHVKFPNQDPDARFPPPTKSDNVLKPLPDKQVVRKKG